VSIRLRGFAIVSLVLLAALGVSTSAPRAAGQSLPSGDASGLRLTVRIVDRDDVPGYVRFSYQQGSVSGGPAVAARRINHVLAVRVARAIAQATRTPRDPCPAGLDACGVLLQRLRSYSCIAGSLCTAQTIGVLPPGANDTEEWVEAAAFDRRTGYVIHLEHIVPQARRGAFVMAVNAAIQSQLAEAGIEDASAWSRPANWKDFGAWLPRPGGVEVWFAKYAVAPGSFGVVHVKVPWSVVLG
jgi:hypothetical protein